MAGEAGEAEAGYRIKIKNPTKMWGTIISTYTLKIILPGSDPVEIISSENLFWCKLDPILNLLEIAKYPKLFW